jgi:hypothetical protein
MKAEGFEMRAEIGDVGLVGPADEHHEPHEHEPHPEAGRSVRLTGQAIVSAQGSLTPGTSVPL